MGKEEGRQRGKRELSLGSWGSTWRREEDEGEGEKREDIEQKTEEEVGKRKKKEGAYVEEMKRKSFGGEEAGQSNLGKHAYMPNVPHAVQFTLSARGSHSHH